MVHPALAGRKQRFSLKAWRGVPYQIEHEAIKHLEKGCLIEISISTVLVILFKVQGEQI